MFAYCDNGTLAFKIPIFEKEYSMKTVMCIQELTLPGRTNILKDFENASPRLNALFHKP